MKATLKRLVREHGRRREQARDLTRDALAAVRATARIQRVHQDKHRRKETETRATRRVLVDLALLPVLRDGLLRRSDDRRSSKRPKAQRRKDGTPERPSKPAQRLSAPSRTPWLETALSPPLPEIPDTCPLCRKSIVISTACQSLAGGVVGGNHRMWRTCGTKMTRTATTDPDP